MKEYCSGQELLSIVISLKPSLFFFSALFVLLSWPAKETSARPAGWTLMNTPSNIYFVYVSGRCLYRENYKAIDILDQLSPPVNGCCTSWNLLLIKGRGRLAHWNAVKTAATTFGFLSELFLCLSGQSF